MDEQLIQEVTGHASTSKVREYKRTVSMALQRCTNPSLGGEKKIMVPKECALPEEKERSVGGKRQVLEISCGDLRATWSSG